MAHLKPVHPYSLTAAAEYAQQLVERVDELHWGTDATLGDGDWWNYRPAYAYGYESTSDQSTILAGDMITCASILHSLGRANDTLLAHAAAAVAQMLSGAYASNDLNGGMTGAGDSAHQFIYHWGFQGLAAAYQHALPGIDRAAIQDAVRTAAWNAYPGTKWQDGGVENMSQAFGTLLPTLYRFHQAGLNTAADKAAVSALAFAAFLDGYVVDTAAYLGDFTYIYGYNTQTGKEKAYKAYYHNLMLRGLLDFDDMLAAGFVDNDAEHVAKLKNLLCHALGQWGMSGTIAPDCIQSYRDGVIMRHVQPLLAAVACNPTLQWETGVGEYCRYLFDRTLERIKAADGKLIGGNNGAIDTADSLGRPVDFSAIVWHNTDENSKLLPAPTSPTVSAAETAMYMLLCCEKAEFWDITPARPDMTCRWASSLGGYYAHTPRYTSAAHFVTHSGRGNFPLTQGPEPSFILDHSGEPIGSYSNRHGSPGGSDGSISYQHLACAIRESSKFFTNNFGGEVPDALALTDGEAAIADGLTPITGFDTAANLRRLFPRVLPEFTSRKTLKKWTTSAWVTGLTQGYDVSVRWRFYRDFALRKATLIRTGASDITADFIMTWPGLYRCHWSVKATDLASGVAQTVYDGTQADGSIASVDGSTANLRWWLVRRDTRGGTAYNAAYAIIPVEHSQTAYSTSSGAHDLTPYAASGVDTNKRLCRVGMRQFVWKSQVLTNNAWTEWAMVPLSAMTDGEALATTQARADNAYTFGQAWKAKRAAAGARLNPAGFQMFFGNGDSFGGMERKVGGPGLWARVEPLSGTANVKIDYSGGWACAFVSSATANVSVTVEGLRGASAIINLAGTQYNCEVNNGSATVSASFAATANTVYALRVSQVTGTVRTTPLATVRSSTQWQAI